MLKRTILLLMLAGLAVEAAAQQTDSVDWRAGGEFRTRIGRHTSPKTYRWL